MDSRIHAEIEHELAGYSNGAPEDLTSKFRECLGTILRSRKPNAIKDNLPRLVRFVERIVLESSYCPKCGDSRGPVNPYAVAHIRLRHVATAMCTNEWVESSGKTWGCCVDARKESEASEVSQEEFMKAFRDELLSEGWDISDKNFLCPLCSDRGRGVIPEHRK